MRLAKLALDIRDDMHDMAIALDCKFLGYLDRADFGDAPDIIAPEIEQHQVLGAFLFICKKFRRQIFIFGLGFTAPAGARDWPDGDFPALHANEDFGARTDNLKRSQIKIKEEWRRIDPRQRPVKRKIGPG